MAEDKDLTLETAAGGAAPELFAYELRRVLENIKDPNTTLGKREIRLVFTFEPHDDKSDSRREMMVSVEAKAKLQPVKPVFSYAFLVRQGDQIVAKTHDVRQGDLLEPEPGVHQLRRTPALT